MARKKQQLLTQRKQTGFKKRPGIGYINAKAAKTGSGKQGAAIQYGKSVKVTSKNYGVYQNFNWKKKNIRAVNKTYLAKYIYYHINGLSYLSLYDNKGKWIGYINAKAVKSK
ncbi:hypothetical protein [Heyndrickxia coagulans]|uniref:hypothetical protein n=1 Tax=Heyndrickxia coagulans TaxID=1398 RepID=UPI001F393762|nr:hypothetical protein [Heyndrickxia coagulans]